MAKCAIGKESIGTVKNGTTYSTNLGVIISDVIGESYNEVGEFRTKFNRETIEVDAEVRSKVIIRHLVDCDHPCGGGPLLNPPLKGGTFAITTCSNSAKGPGLAP